MIEAGFIGALPRPYALARYINRFNSGKISKEKLEEAYRRFTARALKRVVKYGLRHITDGMFRWDDIFNPLNSFIEGVEVNGLVKFFDNNFFFRAPVVKGKLKLRENPICEWIEIAKKVVEEAKAEVAIKQPVPGPYTFADHAIDQHYGDKVKLIEDYAFEVLEPLMEELSSCGASAIELHEPSLVVRYEDKTAEKAVEVISELARKGRIRVWVTTYFASIKPVLHLLSELKNVVVSVDLITDPSSIGAVNQLNADTVALGVVDARNTKMESEEELQRIVKSAKKRVILIPNTTLDFLPEVVAYRKLRLLGKLARR